jgi:hypothetical protein
VAVRENALDGEMPPDLLKAAWQKPIERGVFPRNMQQLFSQRPYNRFFFYNAQSNELVFLPGIPEKYIDSLLNSKHLTNSDRAALVDGVDGGIGIIPAYADAQEQKFSRLWPELEPLLKRLNKGLEQFRTVKEEQNAAPEKTALLKETAALLFSGERSSVIKGLRNILSIVPATARYDFTRDIAALCELKALWPDWEARDIINKTLAGYYRRSLQKIIYRLNLIQTSADAVLRKKLRRLGVAYYSGLQRLIQEVTDDRQNLIQDPQALVNYGERLSAFFHSAEYFFAMERTDRLEEIFADLDNLLKKIITDSGAAITPPDQRLARGVSLREQKIVALLRAALRLYGRKSLSVQAGYAHGRRTLYVNGRAVPFFFHWFSGLSRTEYSDAVENLDRDLRSGPAELRPYEFTLDDGSRHRTFILLPE